MKKTILIAALATVFAGAFAIDTAQAQAAAAAPAARRIERAADLPRFSYPVSGELEAIVRDPQRFAAFTGPVRRDVESILAGYEIADKATRRQLLGELMQLDMLEGRWDDALRRADEVQKLQEKPADKLLSGLVARAIVSAAKKTGARRGAEYAAEVGRVVARELDGMPYLVIRNDIQRAKAGAETIGETLVLGRVRNVLQPVATRTGALSSDLVPTLIGARYALEFSLPLKPTLVDTYGRYLAAHKIDKPDIWAARDVALPAGRNYATVPIVVWDSGVDTQLFPGRLVAQGDAPAQIAFDLRNEASPLALKPLPDGVRGRLDALLSRSKGLSDLTSDIDSPEATAVKTLLANLPPDQYKAVQEELRLIGVYEHGTHVAGIAMAGNPYARIANARIEFGHTILPDPCPTPELEARAAANFGAYANFIRQTGARVVNMSWGGNLRSYEVELEQCGIGKDQAERKVLARRYFDMHLKALTAAFASLPEVLFVTSAGNSADDPTFNDAYPSGIVLPNLVAVGAVDKAGDEASFTSYGPTVLLHANGYQVDSVVPGGRHIALSGTSMASPQVTNLAAKMLAVKPTLKPAEVIAILRSTADRSDDGRRTLINPAKALAAVGYAP
jgi:subtilisin family serine protease